MTPNKPVNKVDGLLSARRKIEKEIEDIQKKCKHPTKSIKQYKNAWIPPHLLLDGYVIVVLK